MNKIEVVFWSFILIGTIFLLTVLTIDAGVF